MIREEVTLDQEQSRLNHHRERPERVSAHF